MEKVGRKEGDKESFPSLQMCSPHCVSLGKLSSTSLSLAPSLYHIHDTYNNVLLQTPLCWVSALTRTNIINREHITFQIHHHLINPKGLFLHLLLSSTNKHSGSLEKFDKPIFIPLMFWSNLYLATKSGFAELLLQQFIFYGIYFFIIIFFWQSY